MFNIIPWKKRGDESFLPVASFLSEGRLLPQVDVVEKGDKLIVKAEIPGVEKKDIDVYLENRRLTIKGEKKQETEERGERFHRVETSYGAFQRTIELPSEVDESNVDASYKRGILKIVLKKTKGSESRKIRIRTDETAL